MLTGEPLPVTKRAGDKLIGATLNTSGALVMRSERVGSVDGAGADRPDGRCGPALARTDAADGRRSCRLVRPDRGRGGGPHPAGLGLPRSRAELGLRLDQRGGGAHHRLPLCARPGDADVDHGRHRPRRYARRAVPRRGGDREPAPRRYPHRRQDRHPHRRQARLRARDRAPAALPTRRCCAWPPASIRAASTLSRPRSCPLRGSGACGSTRPTSSIRRPASACAARSAASRSPSAMQRSWNSGRRCLGAGGRGGRSPRERGERHLSGA